MKERQGPEQQTDQVSGPAPAGSGGPAQDDPQEQYGNAFVQEMVEAENQGHGAGGGGGSGGAGDPTGVELFTWVPDRMGGISIMSLLPRPEGGQPDYSDLPVHEHVGTPQPLEGHFPDSALNPALQNEHGGTAASAASRFSVGDTSQTFPVDASGSFPDNHHGLGLPNPEWILADAFREGIGWTVEQYYTLNGRRLAGTFRIDRIGYFNGGQDFRIEAEKTSVS